MQHETTGSRAKAPLFHLGDPAAALMLLSRVPVPTAIVFGEEGARRGAAAAWAWPLVGALVASVAWTVGAGLMALNLGPSLVAGIALLVAIAMTGGLHEDGLADCADGLWGGGTRARRLEILRDSRIGSYGTLALIIGIGLRWGALAELFTTGLALGGWVAVAMLSRAGMAAVMGALPFARENGLAMFVGRPGWPCVALAAALALAAAAALLGWVAVTVALAVALGAAFLGLMAHRRFGGQTGDVLGAAQQAGEILGLLTLVALVS